jgi:hypothetical protein
MRGGEEGCQAELVLADSGDICSDFSPIRVTFARMAFVRGGICSVFLRIASNMYVNQY